MSMNRSYIVWNVSNMVQMRYPKYDEVQEMMMVVTIL